MARVQTTGLQTINGTNLKQTLTLTGCTAGNTLVATFIHINNSNNGNSFSVTDSQSQTVNQDNVLTRLNTICIGILSVANINSGQHDIGIDFTTSGGSTANSFFRSALTEYSATSGVVDSASLGAAKNNSSTGPISVTSGSPLAQGGELGIVVAYNESGGATFGVPSGWASIANSSTVVQAEKVLSSTSAFTANCGTLSSAGAWEIVVAAYPLLMPAAAQLAGTGQTPGVVGATNNILTPLTARVRDAISWRRRRWQRTDSGLMLPA